MKRFILFFGAIFYFANSFLVPIYASDFKLIIHDFTCEEEEVVIHYSIINYINFDRPNVSVVFKIMKEEKPIACKELVVTIPKIDDGSEIEELIIDVPCEEKSVSIQSSIFHDETNYKTNYSKRYRIDQFFSGCPGLNK